MLKGITSSFIFQSAYKTKNNETNLFFEICGMHFKEIDILFIYEYYFN